MKLIHLPTGETSEEKHQPYKLLNKYPERYIRAELPEHWRVERYDKSWEWLELNDCDFDLRKDWEWVYFNWNKIAIKGCCQHGSLIYKDTKEISRAEFEYHIYNPWKEGKYAGIFGNENRIEDEPNPYIETSFPRASQARWIEDPLDGKLKNPTSPRIDYSDFEAMLSVERLLKVIKERPDLYIYTDGIAILGYDEPQKIKGFALVSYPYKTSNLDYLQTLAESMGYELVKKEKQAIRWESEENRYTLVDGGLHIVEKEVEEGVFIKNEEIEEMIEKYNQYNERSI